MYDRMTFDNANMISLEGLNPYRLPVCVFGGFFSVLKIFVKRNEKSYLPVHISSSPQNVMPDSISLSPPFPSPRPSFSPFSTNFFFKFKNIKFCTKRPMISLNDTWYDGTTTL